MSNFDRLVLLVADVLELASSDVKASSRFMDDLGANSLDIVNLVWRVEDEFGLPQTDESALEQTRRLSSMMTSSPQLRIDIWRALALRQAGQRHPNEPQNLRFLHYSQPKGRPAPPKSAPI